MIGYSGLLLLIVGYILLDTKHEKLFAPVNCVASILLTIHAIMINDVPFIFVNGFVAVMLAIRVYQQRKERKEK
ncbi:MAG: hypothetical protein V4665_01350 [Patescibacteria group bacterium]